MSVGVVDKTTGDRIRTAGNPLDKVGNLANLTTNAKDNAVNAINEVNAGLNKSWSLGSGNSIANNTDLNDITTVGNYYATTQAAATLSHCPITGAFKLKVLYDVRESAPTYIEQVFNPISSYDEYRRYKSGSAEWSDWHLTNCNLDEIKSGLSAKADLTDLAPAFSSSTAYAVGQYVSYDGNIYKCTSAHSAGAWVAGDFTLVAVGSELSEINSNIANINGSLLTLNNHLIGKSTKSSAGDVVFNTESYLTRYTGFLLISQNGGKNSMYFVGYSQGTNNTVSKVAGTDVTISLDINTGSITVSLASWSTASLFVDFDGII